MFEVKNEKNCSFISAVCTTPWKATALSISRAAIVADFFGIPIVDRRARSIEHIIMDELCDAVVVMNEMPMIYHKLAPDVPAFFHPSMAAQRIARMERGESDRLISTSEITSGDIVVDATLGLGADSLVIASAVGSKGQVIGLESSNILYYMFQYAKQYSTPKYSFVNHLMARIQPQFINYEHWLARASDNSVDVVYFDPMFRHPKSDSSAIHPLRLFANQEELSAVAFFHAKRIARKSVVIKERPQADVFSQFHLYTDKRRGSFTYGVWKKGERQTK